MLAEGDDLSPETAAELLLDSVDYLRKRLCESVRIVPGDEATGVHRNVEGMLELVKAGLRVRRRVGGQREQARM